MQNSLLIELRTEELPPRSLYKLSQAFCAGIFTALKEAGFVAEDSDYARDVSEFATPRRLAVLIENVAAMQAERSVERKGPAVSASFDAAGQPMPALNGFAKSCGVDIAALEKQSGPKGDYFVFRTQQPGEALEKLLAGIVQATVKKLPVAKIMRWGAGEAQFVRPVHGLIMLHGSQVIPGSVLDVQSGNQTLGHRFLSEGMITVDQAADYAGLLENQGSVIADYAARLDSIDRQLNSAAGSFGNSVTTPGDRTDLLGEVTSLVEFPAVYAGSFDPAFLEVPSECLIVSMQQHQRYFPLADKLGKLLPHFLFVSNNKTDSPGQIIHGNERVLRARLSDAKFFFDQDRKHSLAERVPRLANVVYHNKLGTQLEQVQRLQELAVAIAGKMPDMNAADIEATRRAAYLCKADLSTDMVGEFPELQGIMGYYYALHDGEEPRVAEAVKEHYERVPRGSLGVCVGLADKLDTLVGIYGVGLIPTGDKDPFGLRRCALSVLRTLMENKLTLNLMQLLESAAARFPAGVVADDSLPRMYDFMLERLPPYLRDLGFAADEIDAVLSLGLTRMDGVIPRLHALREFRALPEAASLASANKRVRNILRQAQGEVTDCIDAALLVEPAEASLAQQLLKLEQEVAPLLAQEQYADVLKKLASLRPAVDEFFDSIMVMADDKLVRKNRLALLNKMSELFMHVADLSKLQV